MKRTSSTEQPIAVQSNEPPTIRVRMKELIMYWKTVDELKEMAWA